MRRVSERLWLGGLAAAGVVLSHSLSFLFVEPDPHARQRLLDATGHRYFTWVTAVAIGILVAGLAGGTIKRLGGGVEEAVYRRTFVGSAAPLVLIQVVAFIALESVERLVVDGSPLGPLTDPVMAMGCVVQIVVAVVGALLLVALAHGVDCIAARFLASPPQPTGPARAWWATSVLPPTPAPATGGPTVRGPPADLG
jgi:hypothetical protein